VIVTSDDFKESLDDKNDENIEIIKKYIELGIIKNFKVRDFAMKNLIKN
jgi:hypothetical protein